MEEKKKKDSRRKYDSEFKADVLKMVSSGQTVAYASKALGVSENLIYRWKQQAKGPQKDGLEADTFSAENEQLRQRVRQLETEREILKKALAIFSRQT